MDMTEVKDGKDIIYKVGTRSCENGADVRLPVCCVLRPFETLDNERRS